MYIGPGAITNILVKVRPENISESLAQLEASYSAANPGKPFQSRFLDEVAAAQYQEQTNRSRMMAACTLLAILISSLGLFGLSSLQAVRKSKEISVRKVFGARISDILVLY